MVFTRPADPPPKKYPKTKRGKAEKERDRILAMTPEERVQHIQAQERKNAEELRERQERQERWDREQRKMNEERLQREAEEKARQEAQAEIDRRAGIRWPGSIVDPAWLKANPAAVLSPIDCSPLAMEDILSDALDETFKPLFDASWIVSGMLESREADATTKDLAEGLRELITTVIDYAFEVPCEVHAGKELIPATPDLEKVWDRLAKKDNDTIARFVKDLKRSFDSCAGDSKTSKLFKGDTLEALADSAMNVALDADHLLDSFERLTRHAQDAFIDELQLSGYIPTHLDRA